MGRTSYTSNMFSLKLVLCVCIFFVIGMEAAPKPKPKAEPKPQPKAEPKPYPPIRYPPYYNLPDANPGQLYWNGSPNLNREINRTVKEGEEYDNCRAKRGGKGKHPSAPDGTKGCLWMSPFRTTKWGECEKERCVPCKSKKPEDCKFKGDYPYTVKCTRSFCR